MLSISVCLSVNSCSYLRSFDPLDATVSTKCDPKVQKCFSVTQGFVLEHGILYEEAIRAKAALKACQEKK